MHPFRKKASLFLHLIYLQNFSIFLVADDKKIILLNSIPGSSTYGREGDCTKNITLTCQPYLDPTRTIFKKSEAKYFLNGRTLTGKITFITYVQLNLLV